MHKNKTSVEVPWFAYSKDNPTISKILLCSCLKDKICLCYT